jgi:hypothetical protein
LILFFSGEKKLTTKCTEVTKPDSNTETTEQEEEEEERKGCEMRSHLKVELRTAFIIHYSPLKEEPGRLQPPLLRKEGNFPVLTRGIRVVAFSICRNLSREDRY